MRINMKKIILSIVSILLLAVTFISWYIYASLEHIPPHFHANFAIYINDERIDFSDDTYMEDVAGCSITWLLVAKDRAHLHENNGETIHIHHDWVTWGHFFANVNYTFSESFIASDEWKVYVNSWERKLSFILNGEEVLNPYNRIINSKDRLLISYGEESNEDIMKRFDQVSDNAWEYNDKYDPGSCGGTNENSILVALRDFIHSFHWGMNH